MLPISPTGDSSPPSRHVGSNAQWPLRTTLLQRASAVWVQFLLRLPTSQEQKSRIFPGGLTTSRGLPMIVKSSARRRHGPARDVLRTNVPVVGQPSQRAGWGATARAGGGLPAAVADPVGPRAGGPISVRLTGLGLLVGGCELGLTGPPQCATIAFGPRSGTISGRRTVGQVEEPCALSNRIKGGGAKTSQEPNGRTREEGSDRGHPPATGPNELRRGACVPSAGALGPCGVRGMT